MIDKILEKVGLYRMKKLESYRDLKKEPFTEEELSFMLSDLLQASDEDIDEDAETKLFKELKNIDGLIEYLRETANRDMRRYFGALSKEEQLIIRGAYARTNYFKAKIQEAEKGKQEKKKILGLRYG